MSSSQEHILTIAEVAKLFDVSGRTINTWVRQQGLPSFVPRGSRRRYFDRDEVMQWAKSTPTENA